MVSDKETGVCFEWSNNPLGVSSVVFFQPFYRTRAAIRMTNSATDRNENGIPDSWEIGYFGNLNTPAGDDKDKDGLSNIQEYILGTNPLDSDTDRDSFTNISSPDPKEANTNP